MRVWMARRSINQLVSKYNDPAEFERADDLFVRRPIAGTTDWIGAAESLSGFEGAAHVVIAPR
jgi:hypothetical protein